ncbi:MAG: hypothetical protein P4L40_21615 [Terracidiphilus sp.]|nr:hypothetical protein [Terracidiphilus sp.]
MSGLDLEFKGLNVPGAIRLGAKKCAVVGCRRMAEPSGRWCRDCAEKRIKLAQLWSEPGPGTSAAHVYQMPSRQKTAVVVSRARQVWKRCEYAAISVAFWLCLAALAYKLAPFFLDLMQMAVDGLKGVV